MVNDERPEDETATTRAWGALTTRLNESLGRAREALVLNEQRLPSGTLASLDALLAEFERRRIRIAFYGEVKAGKSTLLNAIAGTELSPAAFDPLTSIPVRVTHGEHTLWQAAGRQLHTVSDLEQLMRDSTAGVDEVVVETNLDLLQLGGQVDLVDTPGVGSEAHFDFITAETLRSLDAVVLVVRYPALFTQFTRRLMDTLRADIGKLFVVWNLDAACAELSPEERSRQTDMLRANLAGAQELFLVDARAALRAAQAHDAQSVAMSGVRALTAALTRFAGSSKREVAALREAAKRAHQLLADAHRALTSRHVALDRALANARGRLETVRRDADAEAAEARRQLGELEANLTEIENQATATADRLAHHLRRRLRAHRRQWMRNGDIHILESAITNVVSQFADDVAAANDDATRAIEAAAQKFETVASTTPQTRTELIREDLASEERQQHALAGRLPWLRRMLWHRWYLPGLSTLERAGIDKASAERAAWLSRSLQAVRTSGAATLSFRLAEIAERFQRDQERIKVETNFVASDAEFSQLDQNLPVVAVQAEVLTRILVEARALVSDTD